MGYNDDHYKKDKYGNFSGDEAQRALENGHLKEVDNGRTLYDNQTGEEYDRTGKKVK